MNTIRTIGSNYGLVEANKMSSWRGWQLPTSELTVSMKNGGIWDGCNYWDVFCYLEGNDPTNKQDVDPNFGYVGAYWTPNGNLFTQNNQRCSTCGTELTFDGGELSQIIHGNTYVGVHFLMIPQYAAFCTPIYMNMVITDESGEIYRSCITPNTHSWTDQFYNLYCTPGNLYNITCLVSYGCL